jgi:hypothetical protein
MREKTSKKPLNVLNGWWKKRVSSGNGKKENILKNLPQSKTGRKNPWNANR